MNDYQKSKRNHPSFRAFVERTFNEIVDREFPTPEPVERLVNREPKPRPHMRWRF